MTNSEFGILNGNKILIVSFGGYAKQMGGILPFEFLNYLKIFPDTDKLFYIDIFNSSYHKGIKDISKNIPSTVDYLRSKIQGYTKVLFIGNSGGGYAAILFGSLLNVHSVLAFVPPTILIKKDKDRKYKNLAPLINSVTNYHVYGDTNIKDPLDPHHIKHCENIAVKPNVNIIKMENVSVKILRDYGELTKIINLILN